MPSPCAITGCAVQRLALALTLLSSTALAQRPANGQDRDSSKAILAREKAHEIAATRVVGSYPNALDRLPGSASLVTAAALSAVQPFSATDMLRALPGVHVQEEEGAGLRTNVGIRGLDPDRSRTLLVLEDGVPVALAPYGEPELYYSPPIERMERLEVVKGSGSILFGPQTVGGVLNYVTWEVPREASGDVRAEGGSGGVEYLRVRYGGGSDAARAGFTAFQKRADDLNGLRLTASDATAKFGVRVGENQFGLKISLYDESSNATYVGLTDSLYRATPHAHPAPDDRLRLNRYALTATHDRALGAMISVHTAAYAYQTTRNWQRRDYVYNATGNGLVFRNTTGNRNRAFEVAGIEPRLRALWTMGGRANELEVGARAHVERARDQFIRGGTATSRTGNIEDDELRTGVAVAAFAQNRFFLTERWHISPGVRLEWFDHERNILRTRVRRSTGSTSTRLPEDVDLTAASHVAEVIPGIGTAWTPREGVSVFAGAHRGFAPPRTKDALIYSDATLAAGAQVPDLVPLQLDAESSWNYEAGTRLAPRPYLSLEITAFALDFSNQIITPSLSAGSVSQARLANQGKTRHRGLEGAMSLDMGLISKGRAPFVVGGSATLVHAVFAGNRFMQSPAGDTVNIGGNALPYAPGARANVFLSIGTAAHSLRADAIHVGAQFTDNFETVAGSRNGRTGRIPAYRMLDLAGRYRISARHDVTLVASVKNVSDASYIVSRRPEGIKAGLPRLLRIGVSAGL